MRDFHPLSQPCHYKFLSIFKYNIIFALEKKANDKRLKAKDKGQKAKVRAFRLYPLPFTLYPSDFSL